MTGGRFSAVVTSPKGALSVMKAYTEFARANDRAVEEAIRVLVEPGDIIGYTKAGAPIPLVGGGAAITVTNWLPEEWDGPVIERVMQTSAVEALARIEPMSTLVKHVPRSADMTVSAVAKSSAYSEDTSTNDKVDLTAFKIGSAIRIAEEDLADTASLIDVIAQKKSDWATSYAKFLDNATLGVTAAQNGTTVPFTSLYKALRTTNAATGYTADSNYTAATSAAGLVTYVLLSGALGQVETGDYFEEGAMVVIAHPRFRALVRNVVDTQGRPIFVAGNSVSGGNGGTPDTLFNLPIRWTLGAKTHSVATSNPGGNPLLFFLNRNYVILGRRSGPESYTADPNTGAAFLTDEALVKMRSRRGWAVAHEKAASVVEAV